MQTLQQKIDESIRFIRTLTTSSPSIALILGSGLGDFADGFSSRQSIPTSSIPHYPTSTIPGHKGQLVFGTINRLPLMAFQGRVHFYESGSIVSVCYPVRVAHALGARTLIVTNAAGGINRQFAAGDLMLITDQINMTGKTAFATERRAGMSIYDTGAMASAMTVADHAGIPLRRGIYAGVLGPSYETASEVDMLYRAGADAVGMSTVLETELAASLQMRVLGISCITNKATGVGTHKLNHEEVTLVANKVKLSFAHLLTSIIAEL